MEQMLDPTFFLQPANLIYGLFIFAARVVDVSLGTLRTIAIVHGRTTLSFWLGFFESAIWLAVVSTIVQTVASQPLYGVIYAFGFATGNTVGIKIEKRIALGNLILRVISRGHAKKLTDTLRNQGYRVTTFSGEGKSGPVTELYIVCRRRDLKSLLGRIMSLDPEAFYVTEQAGSVSNVYRPIMQQVTGWRAILKKK
ncbi:DUF2179 domain-containing protein [Desulfofustis limnaeus]|jgi:uncharacterized protein YebE (UPF0316 family)|uniref:UPF0316 protein DPPLL_02480 n=1 Tax=Desulfofustis limnaeus TaxID=2740163 RepID=A0ABM7W4P5_9BACT|nr:DUF5698 domain-containing protein [Desulfofustis limnaeus]MDX9894063.1 DUF5698 domain-containing protein [Desulfofustis sp.]BDD85883.1 DUF2179 domain-containing protein [Desulfofustis limnaeus]